MTVPEKGLRLKTDGFESQCAILCKAKSFSKSAFIDVLNTQAMTRAHVLRLIAEDQSFQFGGDFRSADMVKSFLVAGEYRQRFGPP